MVPLLLMLQHDSQRAWLQVSYALDLNRPQQVPEVQKTLSPPTDDSFGWYVHNVLLAGGLDLWRSSLKNITIYGPKVWDKTYRDTKATWIGMNGDSNAGLYEYVEASKQVCGGWVDGQQTQWQLVGGFLHTVVDPMAWKHLKHIAPEDMRHVVELAVAPDGAVWVLDTNRQERQKLATYIGEGVLRLVTELAFVYRAVHV